MISHFDEFSLSDLKIGQWIDLKSSHPSHAIIDQTLAKPVQDFLNRPRKMFRARLVDLGYFLCQEESRLDTGVTDSESLRRRTIAASIIEAIHAGALIIDDIQDGSKVRRNAPTLHVKYGVGNSINVGNWLYFWPLAHISALGLEPSRELTMYQHCIRVLAKAHLGQAIDLGTKIDMIPQADVSSICESSLALKTGTLMALSLSLGALISPKTPNEEMLSALSELGSELGVALQMFDDAGNFVMDWEVTGLQILKRHEDLYLRRPSWVWAHASQVVDSRSYNDFVEAVRKLPDESYLKHWVELHKFIPSLRSAATERLHRALEGFNQRFGVSHPRTVDQLMKLGAELEVAYGK